MPDVVVANKGAVARPGWDGGVLHHALFKEVERRLISQGLERPETPVSRLYPELWVGEVNVAEGHVWRGHTGRLGGEPITFPHEG